MMHFSRKKRVIILIILLVVIVAAGVLFYRSYRSDLLDDTAMTSFADDISDKANSGYFDDQDKLTDYITSWADEQGLEYKKDKADNIIFVSKASDRKKNLSPTVVCVSCNYETAGSNSLLLASAAMIASTELDAGRKTVIFVNDEKNSGMGYRTLSNSYFKKSSKVIYLDQGSSAYISNSSFGRKYSTITVKAGRYKPVCDSAVRVHISGIGTDVIGTDIGKHPDPVGALGTLLSRLKSRSVVFQLADFEIGNNGSMYPDSMDATIMLNSYALPSFTKYIDKRIKAWEKAYGDKYPELSYTYEIIEDPDEMPEKSYSRSATEKLTNVLYLVKNGAYKFEDFSDIDIPDGFATDDICGINAVLGMRAGDGEIYVNLMTQAYDDACMQRISDDNTAAAELFDAEIRDTGSTPRFLNEKDSLYRTFNNTYMKSNSFFIIGRKLSEKHDSYFTPCSYLAAKNEAADIIHLRLSSSQAHKLTNTILCYIAYKGNILF